MNFIHRKLEFLNPVFRTGLNYTVRLGTKWACLRPGDVLELDKGFAMVRVVIVTTLGYVPSDVLEKEHDPYCENLDGLIVAMTRAYPAHIPKGRAECEQLVITCIGFHVYDRM